MAEAAPGQLLLDRYRLERELGAGGMAVVWLAHDERHDRKVAVKIIRAELSSVLGADRFLREIRLTARLQHPHIVSLIDSGALPDGRLCYVMPFVQGETLRQRLARDGRLPVAEALRLGREMSEALAYAHRQGIVHRDIKPENVMLSEGHALVADFGIATAAADAGSRLTQTGMSLGTPLYMAPEQAAGDADVDARADVYSLASVLYEMLAGEVPFAAVSPSAVLAAKLTQPAPHVRAARPEVPDGVDQAIVRALQVPRDERFATAAEFGAALASAESAAQPRTGARSAGSRRWMAVAAVAAVALLVAAARFLRPRASSADAAGRSDVTFTKLTDLGTVNAVGASADGKRFAYVGDSGRRIFVQNLSDGAVRQVGPAATEVRGYRDVDWSTPGDDILVKGTVRGIQGYWHLSASSGEFRLLSEVDERPYNANTVWRARSGRWLVLLGGGAGEVLVGDGSAPPMRAGDGEGGGRRIPAPPGLVSMERAAISPSGELVAVSGIDTSLRTRTFVVEVQTGRTTLVEGATSRQSPIWLDDQTLLTRAEQRERPATDLIRYRYRGGRVDLLDTLLTGGAFVSTVMPVPGRGEAIVFKDVVAVSAYRVLPLAGGPAREVIRSTSSVYDVEWLPDSSLVATRQEDGHVAILRGRPGSPLTPVARIPGNQQVNLLDVDAAGRRILVGGDLQREGDVSWILDVETGELRGLGRTLGLRILNDSSVAAIEFNFIDQRTARLRLMRVKPPAPPEPLAVPTIITTAGALLVDETATHMAVFDSMSVRVVGPRDSVGVVRPFPPRAVPLELEGDTAVIGSFGNAVLNRPVTPASLATIARYSLRTGAFTPLAAVPRGCGSRRLLRHLDAVILTCREVRERDLHLMKLPS